MFGPSADLTRSFLKLKFSERTKAQCAAVIAEADAVIAGCEAEAAEVYRDGPRIHGRAQSSRLDLLSLWKDKAIAARGQAASWYRAAKQ